MKWKEESEKRSAVQFGFAARRLIPSHNAEHRTGNIIVSLVIALMIIPATADNALSKDQILKAYKAFVASTQPHRVVHGEEY